MARRRIIDPDFWTDEEISSLSPMARLLYIGLWGICDDNYATFPNRPNWIKMQIFPYQKNVDITKLLNEIIKIGKILPFEHEKKSYLFIKNFFKHQVINKPSRPKYPEFIDSHGIATEYHLTSHPEKKRREVKDNLFG